MRFLKKFIATILIILVFANTTHINQVKAQSEFVCRSTFTDIEANTALCYYVNVLDFQRVINGYSDLTYRADNYVTREQFAKYIALAFEIDSDVTDLTEEEKFTDITEDNKFYNNIYSLKRAGIINGFSDHSYRPLDNVTRASAQKYIVNAAKSQDPDLFENQFELPFTDITSENTFYEYVSKAYWATIVADDSDRIISDNPDHLFRPNDPLTRGELAKMVANAMWYGDFRPRSDIPRLSTAIEGIKPDEIYQDSGYKVYQYKDFGMTIIATKEPFEFNYIPKDAPTIATLADTLDYVYAINGSFFANSNLDATHAGFLNYYGLHLTPISEDSRQVTHIVRFDSGENKVTFIDRKNFVPTENSTQIVEFQTGPIVIQDNNIERDFIFNSENGRGAYARTLLAISNDGDEQIKYFITVRTQVSLTEIANIFLNLNVFRGQNISVMNLDGGSSVAMYSEVYPELNFGTGKRLPIIIGLK